MEPTQPTFNMPTPAPAPTPAPKSSKINFSFDLRWISLALLLCIIAMLVIWKPWQTQVSANARTVSVTGDSTVKGTPDEYGFNPTYEFKNADKAVATKEAGDRQAEIVAKLKALGVADSKIKTDISGYENYDNMYSGVSTPVAGNGYTYTLQLTVSVATRAEAQKVQDYLATTSPTGSVTPYPQFSESLRKKLESQARDSATKDARAKADQSAKNLGFKVGSVKNVDDDSGFGGGMYGLENGASLSLDTKAVAPSIAVQPGENELSYSVTVVYYIK